MEVYNEFSIYKNSQNTYITPEEFGAIGDGVVDDSDSLQKAINYACNKKIKLLLNGKTYLCESSLNIPNGNNFIIGAGARCSRIKFIGYSGFVCEAEHNGDKFCSFKDFSIIGDNTEDTTGISFKRLSYNELLNNVIVSGFDTAVYMENCYVNKLSNSFISGGTKYGLYQKTCTVTNIEGGTIKASSGTSYHEFYCYNNRVISTDISAYSGTNVEYCVYIDNGFGSYYSFYYEGNLTEATPTIAGICFYSCINCKFENASVTNNNTVPAVKMSGACKCVEVNNIYFNFNNLTSGSVGVYISSSCYECIVRNCRFKNYETSIDVQSNTRVLLDTIEFEGTSGNNLIKISNTESTHVIINNIRNELFESAIKTTWPLADVNIISITAHRSVGSTTNRPSTSCVSGEKYFNTTTKRVEYWNGNFWIALDGS